MCIRDSNENASKSEEALNQPDASENAQPGGGGSGSGKQQTSESEKGRIPHQQTDGVSAPVGGSVTKNSEYQREQYDRAASDIERIQMCIRDRDEPFHTGGRGIRSFEK